MKRTDKLTDEQAQEMLACLEKHFGCPVMPVVEYCAALRTWRDAIQRSVVYDRAHGLPPRHLDLLEACQSVELAIVKSSLLNRLIYEKEPIRQKRCPLHDGIWSGLPFGSNDCEHGCDLTGWIR